MSIIDSPLRVDEFAISILIKSADSFFDANSKVVFVLVLGSKKRLATVLFSRFLFFLLLVSIKFSAMSNISIIWSFERPSMLRKCISFPSLLNCMRLSISISIFNVFVQPIFEY